MSLLLLLLLLVATLWLFVEIFCRPGIGCVRERRFLPIRGASQQQHQQKNRTVEQLQVEFRPPPRPLALDQYRKTVHNKNNASCYCCQPAVAQRANGCGKAWIANVAYSCLRCKLLAKVALLHSRIETSEGVLRHGPVTVLQLQPVDVTVNHSTLPLMLAATNTCMAPYH